MTPDQPPQAPLSQATSSGMARRILTSLLKLAVFAVPWFWLAGGIRWWHGWALLLTFIAMGTAVVTRLSRIDPQLLQERSRPAPNVPSWDRTVMRLYTIALVVLLAVAALDSGRWRWSQVPQWVQLSGWLALLLAIGLIWHCMMVNTFLSKWARIQNDRGQQVVTTGAYARVRHPMYLGIVVTFLALPLVLASWWSLIPAVVIVGLFVYRTKREDQLLTEGLAGYEDYARRVRFRILPGVCGSAFAARRPSQVDLAGPASLSSRNTQCLNCPHVSPRSR